MMKSKYVLIVTAIAAVVVIGLLAAFSANSAAKTGSSDQQCVSTTSVCPFIQPAFEHVSDGGCKKKCDPNCTNECCKKKSDPNCTK